MIVIVDQSGNVVEENVELSHIPRISEHILFHTSEGFLGYRVQDVKYVLSTICKKLIVIHVNEKHLFQKDFSSNLVGESVSKFFETL